MQEVYDFLKAAQTYYLATVEGDQPRVRPFATYLIFEDKFYIQTGKVKPVSKQLAVNPKIEICAFDGETWLRLAAETETDDRLEVKEYSLEQFPDLKAMYAADDDNIHLLRLKNATATFSTFAGVTKVVKF